MATGGRLFAGIHAALLCQALVIFETILLILGESFPISFTLQFMIPSIMLCIKIAFNYSIF